MKMIIYVVGYPKSGNTWLARLLGDVLDCPIRAGGNKLALADGGYSRQGKYIIRQGHITECPKDGKVVWIKRDPRDVSVAARHYWKIDTLAETIKIVGEGLWPIQHGGGWEKFNDFWNASEYHVSTTYEALSRDTEKELTRIIHGLFGLFGGVGYDAILDAIERESFENRKSLIEKHGDDMPYGKNIQLINMRKGIVGDWKNHYTQIHKALAEKYFGDAMRMYGYDAPEGWCDLDKE